MMHRIESETSYLRRRAKEEARLAQLAVQPEVAIAHRGLSDRYSGRMRSPVPHPDPGEAASVHDLSRNI